MKGLPCISPFLLLPPHLSLDTLPTYIPVQITALTLPGVCPSLRIFSLARVPFLGHTYPSGFSWATTPSLTGWNTTSWDILSQCPVSKQTSHPVLSPSVGVQHDSEWCACCSVLQVVSAAAGLRSGREQTQHIYWKNECTESHQVHEIFLGDPLQ